MSLDGVWDYTGVDARASLCLGVMDLPRLHPKFAWWRVNGPCRIQRCESSGCWGCRWGPLSWWWQEQAGASGGTGDVSKTLYVDPYIWNRYSWCRGRDGSSARSRLSCLCQSGQGRKGCARAAKSACGPTALSSWPWWLAATGWLHLWEDSERPCLRTGVNVSVEVA